ncbi:MAG: DNA polymerase III subunit beta [Bacteroidales bacterium]|nr:DNA polymerase III subunit beta [Bacteroidales bacterium]
MKFIINSQIFSKQLQTISGVLTQNNTVPIVNCFHFHIDGDLLTVTATDLETTMVAKIQLESGRAEGLEDVAVPSRILLDTLKNMDDVPMTFTVDANTFGIEIASGKGKYCLAGQNPETYPALPELEDAMRIELPMTTLIDAVEKTAFAASTEPMRQQMAGIYFVFNEDGMTTVATDAHKLVRYRHHGVKSNTEMSFIAPRKPIILVKNILASSKGDEPVVMECNNKNVTFSFDNMFIVCRLVDGKYPNVEAAIPRENPNHLNVDRLSLLNVLKRVGLFASQSTHQVRLALMESEMSVSAEDIEFSNNAQEKMACRYEGEPMEIGFNAKFLSEMLNNIDTPEVTIEMSQPNRAGIIFPVYDSNEVRQDEILMLVMPVMLAN